MDKLHTKMQDSYWTKRAKEPRLFLLFVTIGNFVYELLQVVLPQNLRY